MIYLKEVFSRKTRLLTLSLVALLSAFAWAGDIPEMSVDRLRDPDALLRYADEMGGEVERVRGLEIGRDFSIEYMTVPDFAYYSYLKDREERDPGFADALRLFLYGFGADEDNWTDPDVASIAGARAVQGVYEPEDSHLIITGNASNLISVIGDVMELAKSNNGAYRKAEALIADLLGDEGRAKALAARQTLFHELVHAGQDRNFGLSGIKGLSKKEFDFFLAYKSLVEGDATLSSMYFLCGDLGFEDVVSDELIDGFVSRENERKLNPGGSVISPITLFDDPLGIFYSKIGYFPYSYGFMYTGYLFRAGAFDAVNDAFLSPPATTRQILHPDRDAAGDFSVDVYSFADTAGFKTPRLAGLLNGENISMDTTLGEVGVNALLDSFGIYSFESDPAEGWAGDRIRMYTDDMMRNANFWFLSWETDAAARRFYSAYRDVIADKCSDDPGPAAPGAKPLAAENLCGSQFMKLDGKRISIAELPWRLDTAEMEEVKNFLDSVQIETMSAAELSMRLVEKYL